MANSTEEALKARMLGNKEMVETPTPAQNGGNVVKDKLNEISNVKKGYAGEEDVDYLADILAMHQEALNIMSKEIAGLKQIIIGAMKKKKVAEPVVEEEQI